MFTVIRKKFTLLWIVWFLISLLFLYQQNSWSDETIANQQGQQTNIVSTLVPPAPAHNKIKYRQVLDRSIFSLTQEASDSDLTVTALGILTFQDGLKALIKFSPDETAVLLSIGDRYKSWQMVSLESDHITLKGSNGTFRVNFAHPVKTKPIITPDGYQDVEKMVREVEEIINGSNTEL